MTDFHKAMREVISRRYIGEKATIDALFVALVCGGHVLIEGVPGLAKTTLAQALAGALDMKFRRIQCTMDLMPSDITGSIIYRADRGKFKFIPGPIFTHILLADELNRASARTQSALLEGMQEHQVTVDGRTYPLPDPFFVIATQNSEEERGTFPLPESQLDRFMFRICLGYPSADQELQILRQAAQAEAPIAPMMHLADFMAIRESLLRIKVSDEIYRYIALLIRRTREDSMIERGASPRAGTQLLKAARGYAWISGRSFVVPDDVQRAFPYLLNHRIVLSPEADSMSRVLSRILAQVRFL